MSPLRMGSATVATVSGADLLARAEALEGALAAGGAQVDAAAGDRARVVVDKVRDRLSLTGDHTVVAFAGATGSGKSSLFNAVVGAEVATIGARRPTTSTPTAAIWGADDAGPLLDWLQVGSRHHVGPGADPAAGVVGSLSGLVLLDLPDFDSREVSHRAEAERVLDLVDVFVWVTDPQKYADARLHDDYVAALSAHDAVTVVVLNQIDRLTADQAEQCAGDLKRLLAQDGLPEATVLRTSARTGAGVPELRQRLANAVAGQTAGRTRLAADLVSASSTLASSLGPAAGSGRSAGAATGLVDALSRAAGIPAVAAAVDRDYRHEASGHVGWPFTRWVRALRPRPLARLRLDEGSAQVSAEDVRSVLGRSSLPPPTPAARAAVDLATRELVDQASAGLPVAWSEAVHDAGRPRIDDLTDALDRAVTSTPLRQSAPAWWRVVGLLQILLAVAAVAGLLWLLALAVMGWLQLPQISTPMIGWFPVPTVLLGAGLLLGLLLAAICRPLVRVGARRRAAVTERRLREAVGAVAQREIIAPVDAVLERRAETAQLLATASGRPQGR